MNRRIKHVRISVLLSLVLLPTVAAADRIFSDGFDIYSTTRWDNTHEDVVKSSNFISGEYALRRELTDGFSTGSCDKGFADNAHFTSLPANGKTRDVTIELQYMVTDLTPLPTDGSMKIAIIESWPDTSYPSTAQKSFQAILEIDGRAAHHNEFVVTIKREGDDPEDFPYTYYSGVTAVADTVYRLRLRAMLDTPYTASNGVVQLSIGVGANGTFASNQIDVSNGEFILNDREGGDIPKGLNAIMLTAYTGGSGNSGGAGEYAYWDKVRIYDNENNISATRVFYKNYDDTDGDKTTMVDVLAASGMTHVGRTSGMGFDGDHSITDDSNWDGGSGYSHIVCHGNDDTGSQDQYEDVGESSTGEHYVSFWYRIDATYAISPNYSHKYFRAWHSSDPNMNDIMQEFHLVGGSGGDYPMDAGPLVDNVLTTGDRVGFSYEPAHETEMSEVNFRWHQVEVYFLYDTPAGAGDGTQTIWVDGTRVMHDSTIQLTKEGYPSYTRFSMPSNKSDSSECDNWYVDELEIWEGMPVVVVVESEPDIHVEGCTIVGGTIQ